MISGVGGFYLHTVALQLGSVNGATAALVVGETVIPGLVGIIWLGDNALPGRTWLAVLGFIFAVVGAIAVAWSGAVEASAEAERGGEKAIGMSTAVYERSTKMVRFDELSMAMTEALARALRQASSWCSPTTCLPGSPTASTGRRQSLLGKLFGSAEPTDD